MKSNKQIAVALLLALSLGLLAGCRPGHQTETSPSQEHSAPSKEQEESEEREENVFPLPEEPQTEPSQEAAFPQTEQSSPPLPVSRPERPSLPSPEPAHPMEEHPHHAFYQSIWEQELSYLASMQLSNGAFPKTKKAGGKAAVNAYFSNAVCMALLDAGTTYQQEVKAYLLWHFAHMNTAETDYNGIDGTIYDYWVFHQNGVVEKEELQDPKNTGHGHYDSTDSLASTFLTLLEKYAEKTGDLSFLRQHTKEIDRKLSALRSTMTDGLTLAKPDYPILYLMDNCETYEGFSAAEQLYERLGEKEKAAGAKKDAKAVKAAIFRRMWQEEGQYYEPALNKAGRPVYPFDWENWYPGATSQLFLIHKNLIAPESAEAKRIYETFNAHFSAGTPKHCWEKMDLPVQFYWCIVPYTAAMLGDEARLYTYFTHYAEGMDRHAYPLYNADIAKAAMAAYLMKNQTA